MSLRPLVNEPDIHEHVGFMLAEDEALKKYLSGIEIPGRDPDSPKVKVGVWFRWPESERQIKYPFITIDSINAEPAYELFHSEHMEPATYWPDKMPQLPEPPGWPSMNWGIRNFLPFKLTYQVNVYSRYNLHDRYLRSIFVTDVFPPRPFWVGVDADNSWRRTELLGYATNDQAETSESGTKRIFRKVWTVQMLAEVPQERLADSLFYKVFRVHIPVYDRERLEQFFEINHEGVEVPTPTPAVPPLNPSPATIRYNAEGMSVILFFEGGNAGDQFSIDWHDATENITLDGTSPQIFGHTYSSPGLNGIGVYDKGDNWSLDYYVEVSIPA